MNHEETYAIQFAKKKAKEARFWFVALWWVYLLFVAFGWVLTIAVFIGLAIMLYFPREHTQTWVIWLLIASGTGLILQVIPSVMRFRERAIRARRQSNRLEVSILKFQEGQIGKEELIVNIEQFSEEDCQEEAP